MRLTEQFRRAFFVASVAMGLCLVVPFSLHADDKDADTKKAGKKPETEQVQAKHLTLQVPKTWKQEKPSNKFRVAQFKIPAAKKDKQSADMVVYWFGGGGGGVQANIRRWINQFQAQKREFKLTQGKSQQGPYIVVDVKGTYNKPIGPPIKRKTKPMPNARMLAVILHVKKQGNYFLKLTGPEKTVTQVSKPFRTAFGGDKETEKKLPTKKKK